MRATTRNRRRAPVARARIKEIHGSKQHRPPRKSHGFLWPKEGQCANKEQNSNNVKPESTVSV
jgi:hypothetical protein